VELAYQPVPSPERAHLAIGIDSVEAMVRLATPAPTTLYALGAAESLPFRSHFLDLLTVSSGVHGVGETKIVVNSKTLHHLLPDLVPPIDDLHAHVLLGQHPADPRRPSCVPGDLSELLGDRDAKEGDGPGGPVATEDPDGYERHQDHRQRDRYPSGGSGGSSPRRTSNLPTACFDRFTGINLHVNRRRIDRLVRNSAAVDRAVHRMSESKIANMVMTRQRRLEIERRARSDTSRDSVAGVDSAISAAT
jgi:hypothetical protein